MRKFKKGTENEGKSPRRELKALAPILLIDSDCLLLQSLTEAYILLRVKEITKKYETTKLHRIVWEKIIKTSQKVG